MVIIGGGTSPLVGTEEDLLMKNLATYEWGQSDSPLKPLDDAVAAAMKNEATRSNLERRLSQFLQSSAPRPAKLYVCQKLALIGTKECVPALANLLTDQNLSHMARHALEANPDPSASAALRNALPKLKGVAKVGVINSLGLRRDVASVAPLAALLEEKDGQVVAAAASALTKIGTPESVRLLFAFRSKAPADLRATVAVACLEAAESLVQTGAKEEAAKRYEELTGPNESHLVRMGAFRALIAVQPQQAFPRVMKALRDGDARHRAVAGETIRTVTDPKPYADALASLPPAAQAIVLNVLGQRKYEAAHSTVAAALGSPDESVRTAALGALGHIGTVEDVGRFVAASVKQGTEGEAAREALVRIQAPGANKAMAAAMSQTPAAKPAVVSALVSRWAVEELPALVHCAEDLQPEVRKAALAAIGTLGTERQVGDLVRILQKTGIPRERSAIADALLAICGRRQAACLPPLLPLTQSSDGGLRSIAIHALAGCGGVKALAAVKLAVEDRDETVRDEAIRALSSWPNKWPDDAGTREILLALARSAKKAAHQILALRGYLQSVQNDRTLPNDQKATAVSQILPLATQPEEKRLVLATIGSLPCAGALELLTRLVEDSAVAEEAGLAIVNLAARSDLKDVSSQQRQKALRAAVRNVKGEATKKKADEMLKGIQ
jgi:HEAT repeat protein